MPDPKQLKFYQFLVVYPELGVIYPAETRAEAEQQVREANTEAHIADARWDDDSRLFWSSGQVGHPITSSLIRKVK
jgi:hypothetical protein